MITSINWEDPRYVQELATILGPQNRIQGRSGMLSLIPTPIKTIKGFQMCKSQILSQSLYLDGSF